MMFLAEISCLDSFPVADFVVEDEVIEPTISEFTFVTELFPV